MNNEIKVSVMEEGEKVYMVFAFAEPLKIEITSDDQENTKKVFYKILENFIDNKDIKFTYIKEKEDLYSEVTEKYVGHLNTELVSLKNNFDDPIENEYNE